MTRILCLHGHGTNGSIFEAQLSMLKTKLPEDVDLVFAEGDVECPRAPGIPPMVPGPFLCYFNNFSFPDLRAAHELLNIIIEEDGPFDGVFGFSQGASLAISYLLEQRRQTPDQPLPFKFAVFFSPTVALSSDQMFCAEDIENITEADFDFFAEVVRTAGSKSEPKNEKLIEFTKPTLQYPTSDPETRRNVIVSSVGGILRAGLKTDFLSASEFESYIAQHDKSIVPRVFHPALLKERINIPAVHVFGKADDEDLQAQFKVMPSLCQSGQVRTIAHGGGHDLPRAMDETQKTAKAIEWAIEQGRFSHF